MLVILDAGHGKETPGKRSPIWADSSQLFEYEFNRHVVQIISQELKKKGINTYILVQDEFDMPLCERVTRVNYLCNHSNEKVILISIHANAGGGTGWEVFTSVGQTKSDILAIYLFNAARRIMPEVTMRTDKSDGDVDKEAHFYILRKTICPAVLTENMFMDTEKDCRFIMSLEGRKKIALLHIDGITKYINYLKDKL